MRNTVIQKGSLAGVLMSIFTLSASAQKLDEKQLKTNVAGITNPMQYLQALKPVTFNFDTGRFKHLKLSGSKQFGFLAEQTGPQFPELVFEAVRPYSSGKNSTSVARYTEVQKDHLIPILVTAVKEQQEQIDMLRAELEQLKAKAK